MRPLCATITAGCVLACALMLSCSDNNATPAECREIVDACHGADMGSAAMQECHEFAEESGRTADECSARRSECLEACSPLAQALFVAHEGAFVSYDVGTKQERPGAVQEVSGPVDSQTLDDGTVITNLTLRDEILVVNGKTMLQAARVRSSGAQGVRPVHGYISPERNGKRYWLVLNDGTGGEPATNSAAFLDVTTGSATRFQRVGEVQIGIGHHKAAFSNTLPRVVISNIADCDNVLSVYDYSNIGSIQTLTTLTATAAGWTASDPGPGNRHSRFCDPTFQRGEPPAPHGCATSKVSGKTYCNLTSSGEMVVVTVDASSPTFTIVPTDGEGGGFTLSHPAGRYLYTMQEAPREEDGGVRPCQIGQIAVTDASTDTVVSQTPVLYKGPSCTEALKGTPAETANPGHAHFTHDGNRLYIPTSGGFNVADARVNQVIVLNTSDPAHPVQLPSVQVGVHTGHSASALSGDGKWLFVVNTVDGTVSQVDVNASTVANTFTVKASPKTLATFGTSEGPSKQTGPIH
jgi:hypothetical protein